MAEDLTKLAPEEFLRLAVARGGLELDDVLKGLSPQAARVLGWIAQASTSPSSDLGSRGLTGSKAPPTLYRSAELQTALCPNCAHPSSPENQYCTRCGHKLGQEAAPTTLEDLVEQGRVSEQEANEALAAILLHQSHYPAGTRYSVFGGSTAGHAQCEQ